MDGNINTMRCAFCEIPEIKQRTIFENELAWSFLTNIPITVGHTLICPKRCVSSISDMSKEEWDAILDIRTKLEKSIKKTFGIGDYNYAWNDGVVAGQSVPHFHLHMIPRKEGDEGIYGYDPRKFIYRPGSRQESPEEELMEVARLLKDSE